MSETEAAILSRLVDPQTPSLSREAAASILQMQFAQRDLDRMHLLLDKNNGGTISAGEKEEADAYERVGHMLALLQSKARKSVHS